MSWCPQSINCLKRVNTVSILQLYKPNAIKKVHLKTDYDKAEALASQFDNDFTVVGEELKYWGKKITR